MPIHISPAPTWNASFEEALAHIEQGGRAGRVGWNCEQTWLQIEPNNHTLVLMTPGSTRPKPWHATEADLKAQDWHLL